MRKAHQPEMNASRRSRLRFSAPLAASLLLGACGSEELPQNALDPEGPIARQLDNLWDPVLIIAAVIFVIVEAAILVFALKFRERPDDRPKQIHGNARLELAWTIAPALILAVVGVMTVGTIFDINRRAGAEALQVEVVGHQWWWEFRYPDLGIVTANELHIPAGERVQLEITAADVIHSFWIPKLAGKVDTIPGRLNYMQIEADQPGRYWGQCGEYCGLSHGNMRQVVVAHAPDDFQAWAANQQREARAPSEPAGFAEAAQEDGAELTPDQVTYQGSLLFAQKGCNGCHTIDGVEGADGVIGPNLTHFMDRQVFAGAIFELNRKNLRVWLRDPPAAKPMMPDDGIGMPDLGLSEDEITALIAYLETLD